MKYKRRMAFLLTVVMITTTLFTGSVAFAGDQKWNVDLTPSVSVVNTDSVSVRMSWSYNSNFVGGTDVERYDVSNNTSKTIGKVSSDYSYSRYDDTTVSAGSTYRYRLVRGTNISKWSDDITIPKEEDSGGFGTPGNQENGTTISVKNGPQITNATASIQYVPMGKVKINANLLYGSYEEKGIEKTVYNTMIELYRNGKRVDKRTIRGYYYGITTNVSYGKKDTFVLKTFMEVHGNKLPGQIATMKIRSSQMGKNSVKATRINARQAVVRWSGVEGATGYRIMKGGKKVKDVKASVRKYTVKKKGAGKAKYKVLPLRKADGKTYKGKSGAAKTKSNQAKYNSAKSWKSFRYFTSRYVVNKVSLSGRTYTVKGFFYNSAHFTKLNKYKKLTISIVADGKVVASKTYKNVNMNLKAKSQRKRTYKIKGKAGADLRNGGSYVNVSVVCDPKVFN